MNWWHDQNKNEIWKKVNLATHSTTDEILRFDAIEFLTLCETIRLINWIKFISGDMKENVIAFWCNDRTKWWGKMTHIALCSGDIDLPEINHAECVRIKLMTCYKTHRMHCAIHLLRNQRLKIHAELSFLEYGNTSHAIMGACRATHREARFCLPQQ